MYVANPAGSWFQHAVDKNVLGLRPHTVTPHICHSFWLTSIARPQSIRCSAGLYLSHFGKEITRTIQYEIVYANNGGYNGPPKALCRSHLGG